jgi:hypothetical protein
MKNLNKFVNLKSLTLLLMGSIQMCTVLAQSGSIGSLTRQESRSFEKSFFGISFTSKSSACSIAGSAADSFRVKNDGRDMSLGNCDCSNAKRRLLGELVGQYYTQTGKFYIGNDEVDVYECSVNASMKINKTVLN